MPWIKGKSYTESRKKISETLKLKGIKPIPLNLLSEASRQKRTVSLRTAMLKRYQKGEKIGFQKGNQIWKNNSNLFSRKSILKRSGKNHWNWKGGITSENTKIRYSKKYKQWRHRVYKRDNYICQLCGKKCKSKDIIAHHIFSFSEYPKLRFTTWNGITLCRSCHYKIHKI